MIVRPRNPRHRPPPLWRRVNWQAVVGVLLISAAAYSSGSTYQSGQDNQERAECQARVNRQVVLALQQRDNANRSISTAQRQLVMARLRAPGGSALTPRQADQAYLRALDELERTRNANPIEQEQPC